MATNPTAAFTSTDDEQSQPFVINHTLSPNQFYLTSQSPSDSNRLKYDSAIHKHAYQGSPTNAGNLKAPENPDIQRSLSTSLRSLSGSLESATNNSSKPATSVEHTKSKPAIPGKPARNTSRNARNISIRKLSDSSLSRMPSLIPSPPFFGDGMGHSQLHSPTNSQEPLLFRGKSLVNAAEKTEKKEDLLDKDVRMSTTSTTKDKKKPEDPIDGDVVMGSASKTSSARTAAVGQKRTHSAVLESNRIAKPENKMLDENIGQYEEEAQTEVATQPREKETSQMGARKKPKLDLSVVTTPSSHSSKAPPQKPSAIAKFPETCPRRTPSPEIGLTSSKPSKPSSPKTIDTPISSASINTFLIKYNPSDQKSSSSSSKTSAFKPFKQRRGR